MEKALALFAVALTLFVLILSARVMTLERWAAEVDKQLQQRTETVILRDQD